MIQVKIAIFVAGLSLAAAAVPAGAAEGQPADAEVAKPAKPAADPNKKICRRAMATGSMMPKTVCHTRAEWDAMEEAGKRDLERVRMMDQARNHIQGNR